MGQIIRQHEIKNYGGKLSDMPITLPYGDTYFAEDKGVLYKYNNFAIPIAINGNSPLDFSQSVTDYSFFEDGEIVDQLAYAKNSLGTRWLPGTMGGTYYPQGIYIWDGALWNSDRNAIADALNRTGSGTAWAWFVDNQYTEASPLIIASGATAVLTNNSNTVDSTQWKPANKLPFNYLNSKLESFALGAKFNIEIRFKAKSSDVNGKFNIFLDIGTGAVPLVANQKTEIFAFGANSQQFFTMELNYFAGSNLMANDGIIYIESTLGITSIYDIDFLFTLDHTPF
jgi:hypothetical protein